MDKNERDIHFKNFAKLLWQELKYAQQLRVIDNYLVHVPPEPEKAEAIIAQRTHDLVKYVIEATPAAVLESAKFDELWDISLKDIPDLTEWPEPE